MAYNQRQRGMSHANQRTPTIRQTHTSNNFVSGGQLTNNLQQPQQRPQIQQQQRPQGPLQQRPQGQQQQQPRQNFAPNNFTAPPIKQNVYQTPKTEVQTPPPIQNVVQQKPANIPQEENANKPIWVKAGKVSKKERQKRRNIRLSRILQPKNAVMILNELVHNIVYNVSEIPGEMLQYTASVEIEGIKHVGAGRSKMDAKNAAAEVALKHMVKTRQFSLKTKDDVDGDDKMDGIEESCNGIPWQHVASFALYKLINTWGDDFTLPRPSTQANTDAASTSSSTSSPVQRPAKKMPDNAAGMNPMMLVNQMLPNVEFEELGQSGQAPNLYFSYQCSIEGKTYKGTGTSKKAAKKMVAYEICKNVLGVQYPENMQM